MLNLTQILADATSASSGPIDGDSILPKIIPTFWPFIIQLIAFIIMVIVVLIFAYKPVKKLIKKRQEYIEQNIHESETKLAASIEKEKQADEQIIASNKEGKKIIEASRADALKVKEEIIAEAKLEANNEINKAREQIDQEIEKSKDDIHKNIVDVALQASTKVLGREIDSKDNERLIDDFIKDMDNDK